MRRAPLRVASSLPCHASRSTCAGAGEPSSPREPVSVTTSSISARWEAADPNRPWSTSSQLRKPSASGQCGERAGSAGELHPGVREIVPGPIVEDVGRGQDRVEVDDVDVAAGDRLEPCLVFGRAWTPRRAGSASRRRFIGQAGGDAADQLREWVADGATIGDRQRACGDRAPCRRFDEVPAGERGGAGGDTGADRELGVAGLDARERAGQQRRGLSDVAGDDVDQRLRPRRVGLVFGPESARPGAIEDLAGLPPVTARSARRAPPRAAARPPGRDQG